MSHNTVPHRLVDQAGREFRGSVLFAAGVRWQPGDTVMLACGAPKCVSQPQIGRFRGADMDLAPHSKAASWSPLRPAGRLAALVR